MAPIYNNAALEKLRKQKAAGKNVQAQIDAEKARLGGGSSGGGSKQLGVNTQGQAIDTARESVDYQQNANIDANRVSQQGPFGNRQFVQNPDGSWTAKDDLGAQQGLFDAQMGLETGAASAAGSQLATAGLDKAFGSGQDFNAARQKAEDATYSRLSRDFDKDYSREKQQFEQDLYNRGYRPDQVGQDQYTGMMKDFEQGWADRKDTARLQAVQEGGAEFDRAFQADLNTRQQRVSDLQNLNRVGTGLRDPGYFGLSPVQIGNPDFVGAASQSKQFKQNKKKMKQDRKFREKELAIQQQQLALQAQALAKSGGGGGGDEGAYYGG